MAVISNLVPNLQNAANGNTTGFFNFNNTPQQTSTAAFPFSGRTANTPTNIAYGGSPTVPTGGPTNTQPAMTFQVPQSIPSTIANPNAGGTQYSGFNMLNGQPISATNPQATAAQLAANAASQNQQQQQTQTQNNGTSGVATNIFPGLASTVANTQPYTATSNAVGGLSSIAGGQPTVGSTNLNSLYGAQNTLGSIANLQTPAVTNAQTDYNQFAQSNPYMLAAQSNPNVAADVASGRTALLGQTFASELAAKQQAVQNALTGQGQQITAAEQQGGLGATGQGQQITAGQAAGQLANTAQANQIGAQTAALGAIQPQLGAYGQTYYQPTLAGTNQGGIGGVTGPVASGIAQGEANAGQTYAQNQALIGKALAQYPGLQNEITQSNFNANPGTYVNALTNWAKNGTSDPSIPEITNALNDIAGSLGGVLGVPSSAGSDLRTTLAQGIVSSLQQGSSIIDALQFAMQQATAGNQGYLQGATGAARNAQSTNTTTNGVYSQI
jgi:hypothetical protein